MAIENHWFQQSILIMKFVVCSDLIKDVLAQKCESVNLVTRSVVTPEMWELHVNLCQKLLYLHHSDS